MKKKEYNEVIDILVDLQNEFIEEEERLKEISRGHAIKIDELENQIDSCRKNEDIDYRVFSPRNISMDNSDKINSLLSEKESLEKEKKVADKQLVYYSSKSDKIGKVLYILKRYSDISDNIEFSNDDTSEYSFKSNENFVFNEEYDSNDENISSKPDKNINDDPISDLFNDDIIDEEVSDNEKVIGDDTSLKNSTEKNETPEVDDISGIPVDDVERVCHRVEFTEKIIRNDMLRARLELKDIISDLHILVDTYK